MQKTAVMDNDKKVNFKEPWSFSASRSLLAFCLLRQIVRNFQESCEKVLDPSSESDEEIQFLMEILNGLLPDSHAFLEKKFDKDDIVATEVVSKMYEIAVHCLNDPLKTLEFSIHNALSYFLEDYLDETDEEPNQIKTKAIRFFFPDIIISEDMPDAYFAELAAKYRSSPAPSLEAVYLNRMSRFLDDMLELRYL